MIDQVSLNDSGQSEAEARPSAPTFERTISPIAGRIAVGRGGKLVAVVGLVAGCGVFIAATSGEGGPKAQTRPLDPPRQVVPFEPLKAGAGPTLQNPGPHAPTLTGDAGARVPALRTASAPAVDASAARATAMATVRGAPLLAYSRSRAQPVATPRLVSDVAAAEVATYATEFDELRRGSALGRASATRLPDRNFLIVAGTAIPCVLQTAMDTATPGYVSCLIPRDVLSDNGAVVLMEKGTRVLGEYRSGPRQGQRRLFVLWTRAVTPGGVAISLSSPAADNLGRAGFDGDIDTHFWTRFGGALLLSVVDDGAYALSGADLGAGAARVPSDAAGIALQHTVDIPASLRKRQGAEVSIFAAQDFDFSNVYGLRGR